MVPKAFGGRFRTAIQLSQNFILKVPSGSVGLCFYQLYTMLICLCSVMPHPCHEAGIDWRCSGGVGKENHVRLQPQSPKDSCYQTEGPKFKHLVLLKLFKLGVLQSKWNPNPARNWLSAMLQGCRICSPWPASCAGWAQRWSSSSAKTPQCSTESWRCGSSGALDAEWWGDWENSATLQGVSLKSPQVVWFSKSALLFPGFWIWEKFSQHWKQMAWISTIPKTSK